MAENDVEKFTTGAVRSSRMPRYDLIPKCAIDRLAKRFTGEIINGEPSGGALKYGEGNWEKGLPTSDVINHVMNHLTNYIDKFRNSMVDWRCDMEAVRNCMLNHRGGVDDDLAGAMWGIVVLMHQEDTKMFHDDKYKINEPSNETITEHLMKQANPDLNTKQGGLANIVCNQCGRHFTNILAIRSKSGNFCSNKCADNFESAKAASKGVQGIS